MVVVCSIPPGEALLIEPEELTMITPPPPVTEVSAYEACGNAIVKPPQMAPEIAIRRTRRLNRVDFMGPQ